jgi:hypothetical protein
MGKIKSTKYVSFSDTEALQTILNLVKVNAVEEGIDPVIEKGK